MCNLKKGKIKVIEKEIRLGRRQACWVFPPCISPKRVITLSLELPRDIQFIPSCIIDDRPAGRSPLLF